MDSGEHSFRTALNKMRQQSLLCDVTLTVDDQSELVAHRAVLAATSPFFRAIFDPTTSEHQQDNAVASAVALRIPLPGISAAALHDIVGYLYTGEVLISGANVHGLLEAAALLKLPALRSLCVDTLIAQLTTDTCLRIRQLAERHDCAALLQQTDDFIQLNWAEVRGSLDFGRLMGGEPVAEPASTLSFEAQLPPTSGQLMKDATSSGNRKCTVKALQLEAKKPQVIAVFGHNFTAFYDFENYRWTKMAKSDDTYGYYCSRSAFKDTHKMCIINSTKNQDGHVSLSADLYDPITNTWAQKKLKSYGRMYANYALLNGVIYVVGGAQANDTLDWFDTRTDQWQPAASMLTSRKFCSIIVMDGLLYTVGGKAASGHILNSAERYDAATNTWESIASTSVKRSEPGLCVLNGKLYAVGGNDSEKTVEAYDPSTNTWSNVASMSTARKRSSVVAYDGELYVMGGTTERKVEVYCPASDTWRTLNASLPESGEVLNVCLYDRPESHSIDSLCVK